MTNYEILRWLVENLIIGLGIMKLIGIHSLFPFRWSCACEKKK